MDPKLSPQPIIDTLVAYQRSAALSTAIELDVFSQIAAGQDDVQRLARACGTSERGVRSLCDYLVAIEFLTKLGAKYALMPISATFLDRRSERYVGSIASFLDNETLLTAFAQLTSAVRQGRTALGEQGTMAPEHPAWTDFARGMAPIIAPQAEALAHELARRHVVPQRVLDIASGHGLYGIALARRFPHAQVVLQDWASVLPVAEQNATRAGVRPRVSLLPGDARAMDLGGPYDLALVVNFLHHFTLEDCGRFLARLHRSLPSGACIVVVEFLVGPERVSPAPPAMFSLVMLATTNGGDSFTEDEMRGLLEGAGYSGVEIKDLEGFAASAVFARA